MTSSSHPAFAKPAPRPDGVPRRSHDAWLAPDATLISSRAALCRALDALADQRDAITVIGSHAVHERTKSLRISSTTTKDGDLSVTPSLVADTPLLIDAMRAAGFRPLGELEAERFAGKRQRYAAQPGLWALDISDSGRPIGEIDLIVPSAVAGGGRRSPRALKHHGKVASRMAPGIELAVLDRTLVSFQDFESGTERDAFVAGHAALVCAKAYKLGERIVERDGGGRDRVLPKDAADLWRLLATSDGARVRQVFEAHATDPTWGAAVTTGKEHVESILRGTDLAVLAHRMLSDEVPPEEIDRVNDRWSAEFLG
jgi:hypothetical protein